MTKAFGGFQFEGDSGIAVPLGFFTDVMPELSDIAEIQVTIALFRLTSLSGGLAHPIAETSIIRDISLRKALRVAGSPNEPDRRISSGLDLAVGRNTLLKVVAESHGERTVWYYVNTVENQVQVAAMSRGAIAPSPDLWIDEEPPLVQPERPTVFRLYEQNIGILTPLIAERLVDALETYPTEWISDAIGEAVSYNRRSWRYINRILENWAVTGRGETGPKGGSNETNRRSDSRNLDPDQYKHGRYLDRTRNS